MATRRAQTGDVLDIGPLGEAIGETKTRALVKTRELEVLRLVVKSGRTIDTHRVPGDVTVQCLEGRAVLTLPDGEITLGPGQLVYLEGGTPHGVRGLEDSSLLVTIALSREGRS